MSFGEYYGALAGLGDAYQAGLDRYEAKQNRLDAAKIYGDQLTGLLGAQSSAAPAVGLSPLGTPSAPRSFNLSDASGGAAGDYLATLRGKESGGNANAKNPNSTATGIDQFTASTWAGLARKYPQLGLTPDGRTDPAQSTRAMQAFTNDNAKALTAAGVPITPGNLYVSHFLGEAGGPKFIAGAMSNPNAPAAAFVSPGAVAANRSIFLNKDGSPKTAGEVYAERTSRFGGVRTPAPQQVASAATPGEADMPAPDAVPAEYRIPGGGSVPAASDFTPGTIASPAIGTGNTALPAPAAAGPRVTPQQADQLRRMLANPVTAPQAQAMIAKLSAPTEYETKELGGRVVQVDKAGNIRAVPGFEKPPELTQFKGSDGNDYLLNKSTGAITRAIEGKERGFTDLVDPQARLAAGVPASFNGPVQRGPNGELKFPGKATSEVNIDNKGASEFSKKAGGGLADRFDAIAKEGDVGRTELALVGQLGTLAGQIGTGAGAAAQAKLAEYGIKLGPNVSQIEAYGSLIDKLTPTQRLPGAGATSDFDAKLFKSSLPSLIRTPEGNALITGTMEALARDKVERAAIADRALIGVEEGGISPAEAVRQLRALPPPTLGFRKGLNDLQQAGKLAPVAAGDGANGAGRAMPESVSAQAKAAIAEGRPRDAVIAKLRRLGFDASGL